MADTIDLAKPLKLTTPGTAPIAGLTVADAAALEAIESPWLGMSVYVEADGKNYRVTELKDVTVGVFTRKAVKSYELIPDQSALGGKAEKNHNHDEKYAAKTHKHTLSDLSDLSGLSNTYAAKEHNHDNEYAAKDHTHDSLYAAKEHNHDEYAAKEHDHDGDYAPLVDGKVPADNLPENAGAKPATISLPVPYDQNNDNVSLYIDIGTDPAFAEGTYTRIRMTDHYAKMKVFSNEQFHTLAEGHVGVPYYGATVSLTLDAEMMPDYVAGKTYYARYTWMDSKNAYDDWKGFIFSGDIADMEPISTNYETPPKVKALTEAPGALAPDYLDGEIQNYTMAADVTINLANVANVPFGEALICNIKRTGGTLTVINGSSQQTYTETKTYMVVITNFGTMQIAVTETI